MYTWFCKAILTALQTELTAAAVSHRGGFLFVSVAQCSSFFSASFQRVFTWALSGCTAAQHLLCLSFGWSFRL